MPPTLTPHAFIAKWEQNTQKESASAKEHFADLCHLVGVPTPNDPGSGPDTYCFEKSLTKTGGKAGFADVWKRDCFAWEYKGKGRSATLDAAYTQLLLYKEDLGNPPVLVVCDIANYEVHIAFTGYRTRVEKFTNADLANASTRELLRQVFTNPEPLRPVERQETITERAAARLAQIAQLLERRGLAPSQVAPFFMKVLFALFAEDIHILPGELMTQSIRRAIFKPDEFVGRVRSLFRAMKVGDYFPTGERIPQFNGWLFDVDEVLALNADELQYLAEAAKLNWSEVEPAIFGTLFERSLDPSKRAQLGAHYTSRDDILLIVEPVLMDPLRREWDAVKASVEALRPSWETAAGAAKQRIRGQMEGLLFEFMERLSTIRVLDPACGSGNFLYVVLNQLKNLEKEVWMYAGGVGLTQPDLGVTPAQLHGIEKNQFAAELAQVVVWIGYLQWLRNNGFLEGSPREPILQTLHTIECRDAVLTVDLQGSPAEPMWPDADVIIGNPPFLGDRKMRGELGDTYVDNLRKLYDGRVPAGGDLVTYWFEKARELIVQGRIKRAGLLATNSIAGGMNRRVLERIKNTTEFFMVWNDRPWILDGAAVRVAMVGFDDGSENLRILNGHLVPEINADLKANVDVASAARLTENRGLCYLGVMKAGPFDIDRKTADQFLQAPTNSNGHTNRDVVKPRMNGQDITGKAAGSWLIDFGLMSEAEASQYEQPFEYVRTHVKPLRDINRRPRFVKEWWLHGEPRPGLRKAIAPLKRFIVTPTLSKHRLFVWLEHPTIPDHQLLAFAREDDYFFGVLHARPHELWSLRLGTSLEDRPRYTPSSIFETFPFPWSPGQELLGEVRWVAITEAARELVRLRDEWLAGKGAPELPLNQRTLTNLYNRRPDWLDEAHKRLDAAVFDAYGWPHDLSDEELLSRLLALNLERAAAQGGAAPISAADEDDET
jgi:hypothetical protein